MRGLRQRRKQGLGKGCRGGVLMRGTREGYRGDVGGGICLNKIYFGEVSSLLLRLGYTKAVKISYGMAKAEFNLQTHEVVGNAKEGRTADGFGMQSNDLLSAKGEILFAPQRKNPPPPPPPPRTHASSLLSLKISNRLTACRIKVKHEARKIARVAISLTLVNRNSKEKQPPPPPPPTPRRIFHT